MDFKEMNIKTSYEARNHKEMFATTTITDGSGAIYYQETCYVPSIAFNNSPVRKLERAITELPGKKAQCGCDRCSNFRNFSDTFGKSRIYLFSKFHQFIIKLFKIPL